MILRAVLVLIIFLINLTRVNGAPSDTQRLQRALNNAGEIVFSSSSCSESRSKNTGCSSGDNPCVVAKCIKTGELQGFNDITGGTIEYRCDSNRKLAYLYIDGVNSLNSELDLSTLGASTWEQLYERFKSIC